MVKLTIDLDDTSKSNNCETKFDVTNLPEQCQSKVTSNSMSGNLNPAYGTSQDIITRRRNWLIIRVKHPLWSVIECPPEKFEMIPEKSNNDEYDMYEVSADKDINTTQRNLAIILLVQSKLLLTEYQNNKVFFPKK